MADEIYIQVADSEAPVIITVSDDSETVRISVSDTVAGGNTFPPAKIQVVPPVGVADFAITGLNGRTVIGAARSGSVRGITASTTANSLYLQVLNGRCYLSTGDLTQDGELFIFDVI
jgi:hypothetical protein